LAVDCLRLAGDVGRWLGKAYLALDSAESRQKLAHRKRPDRISHRERGQAVFLLRFPKGSSPSYVAELGYSYSTAGNVETGLYKREFGMERETSEFVRELKGKPLVVHCNPNKPSSSAVSEDSIESLLQSRAPKPAWELSASSVSDAVPEWLRPFVWIFIGLSAVGFVLSLWVHFGGVAGRRVVPAPFFWILHMVSSSFGFQQSWLRSGRSAI
jgi:hypothetical protein